MNVFELRDRLIADYASYTRSFITIADPRISEFVESSLNAGAFWPEPLLQLNPTFQSGGTTDDLVTEKLLHPDPPGFELPRQVVEYVFDAFSILREREETERGEYLTKRVVLEAYEAIQEAMRTGVPYQTRLDPPPADPRVAHKARDQERAN